jgi:hypothetical protein
MKKTVQQILGAAVALAMTASGAFAANPANDKASSYKSPWGPANPQFNPSTGFASWVFDQWNPPTQNPVKPPFFIGSSTKGPAWAINVPANIDGQSDFANTGYDAAWISFTGDGHLDVGQSFTTTVLFTIPGPYYGGPYGTVATPTEGIDFMAQSATVPSAYDNFGHQVVGLYLGSSPSGPTFTLGVHSTVSDEKPAIYTKIPIPNNVFNSTLNGPLSVDITFKSLAGGNWTLTLVYRTYYTYNYTYTFYWPSYVPGGVFGGGYWTTVPRTISYSYSYWVPNYITLSSGQYGPTWNTAPTEGIDAVRYFCSQGGITPGGPLEWTDMSVK